MARMHKHESRGLQMKDVQRQVLGTDLFLAQIVHPPGYVCSKLQELLGRQRGSSAIGDGKRRVGLQHAALTQEVQEVSVGSVLDGQVQVACGERQDIS